MNFKRFKYIFIIFSFVLIENQLLSIEQISGIDTEYLEQKMKLQQKLKQAIKENNPEEVKLLLEKGAKVNIVSPSAFIKDAETTPFFDCMLLSQMFIDYGDVIDAQRGLNIIITLISIIATGYFYKKFGKSTPVKKALIAIPGILASILSHYYTNKYTNKDTKYLLSKLKKSLECLAIIAKQPGFIVDEQAKLFAKEHTPKFWDLVINDIEKFQSKASAEK